MPKAEKDDESPESKLPFPANLVGAEERKVLRDAPRSVWTLALVAFIAGCIAIYSLFTIFVVPGKDATIQRLERDLASEQRENEKLRQNLPDPVTAKIQLKQEALELAAQMEAVISKWEEWARVNHHTEFNRLFETWLPDARDRLQRHMTLPDIFQKTYGTLHGLNKKDILLLVAELRKMSEALK